LNVIERARNVILFLTDRKRAYQLAFGSPAGQAVLRDLAKFCRAADTEFHADPRIHAALSGRHINLTPEQLAALYDGRSITIGAKDD
jgi:hypothetical protein